MDGKKNSCIFLVLFLVVHSCVFVEQEKENRREIIAEKEMNTHNVIDCEELRSLYLAYADDFPNDLYAPECLYRAASFEYASELKESINLLNRIIYEYPESAVIPNCYFEKSYIFHYVGEEDSSRKVYIDLVNKFPNHYLVLLNESEDIQKDTMPCN
jgi:hypothetical protein